MIEKDWIVLTPQRNGFKTKIMLKGIEITYFRKNLTTGLWEKGKSKMISGEELLKNFFEELNNEL